MSGTSSLSPSSSTPLSNATPPHIPLTRTLAIIKPHAVKHRFSIEPCIIEAGFEIVKERPMGFHPGDESLQDIFGPEAESLTGDPVWVYVLERRRAVEVWLTLMGDEDPEVAKIDNPNSLRATYGRDVVANGFYGSPDSATAEDQINILFASSPPFPPTELADDVPDLPARDDAMGSMRSTGSSAVSSLLHQGSEDGSPTDSNQHWVRPRVSGFRARPLPPTTATPSIQPRMSRAAALRAGVAPPPSSSRVPASAESIAKTFENVPGHRRASTIAVASTAPPVIAPRPTRASALRTGQKPDSTTSKPRPRPSTIDTFANVPGHKRSANIVVASTAPPTIAPRPTRASSLRTGQPGPTPAKVRPRASTTGETKSKPFEGVPGHKRATTIEVASTKPPAATPRVNRSAMLRQQAQGAPPPSSFMFKAPSNGSNGSKPTGLAPPAPTLSRRASSTSGISVGRLRSAASDSSAATSRTPAAPPRPPSITPRSNKSALLRAAKMSTDGRGTSNGIKASTPKYVVV